MREQDWGQDVVHIGLLLPVFSIKRDEGEGAQRRARWQARLASARVVGRGLRAGQAAGVSSACAGTNAADETHRPSHWIGSLSLGHMYI